MTDQRTLTIRIAGAASLLALFLMVSPTRADAAIIPVAPTQYSVAQSTGTCVSNGSCSAPTPACGETTSGTDNCGVPCYRTGAACAAPSNISASASPASIDRRQSSTIIAVVKDQNGVAFSGADVSFNIIVGEGSLSAASGVTDASGQARTTLHPPSSFPGKSMATMIRSCIPSGVCANVAVTITK